MGGRPRDDPLRQVGGDGKQDEIDDGEDLCGEPQREDGENLEHHRRERRVDETSRPPEIAAGERGTGRGVAPPPPEDGEGAAPPPPPPPPAGAPPPPHAHPPPP